MLTSFPRLRWGLLHIKHLQFELQSVSLSIRVLKEASRKAGATSPWESSFRQDKRHIHSLDAHRRQSAHPAHAQHPRALFQSVPTIVRIIAIYRPFPFFCLWGCLLKFLGGLAGVRFLMFYFLGRSGYILF